MIAVSVPWMRPPPGMSANAQKNPIPTMMPGIACGARDRYSIARANRNVDRRATSTDSSARPLISTAPISDTMTLLVIDCT
jgi:hypothetical protein